MQAPRVKQVEQLLIQKPTVGHLMELCEENYRLLIMIAPDLSCLSGNYCSELPGQTDLHMEVLEQAPYTSLIHLTYHFSHQEGQRRDPDATLRVYHDAQQIEVVDLCQNALPVESNYHHPGLSNKWKVNLFLSKWLAFCLSQGHRFAVATPQGNPAKA